MMHLCNCNAREHQTADHEPIRPDRKAALTVLRAWFGGGNFSGDHVLSENIVNAANGAKGWWNDDAPKDD